LSGFYHGLKVKKNGQIMVYTMLKSARLFFLLNKKPSGRWRGQRVNPFSGDKAYTLLVI
jgi:hypothetical protein